MNSEAEILVVDLDHCIPTGSRHLVKSNCVYNSLDASNCQQVIQIETPVQCLEDLNQSFGQIQQQHLTESQTIPFQEIQISYEDDETEMPLYHDSTIQTFSPSQSYQSSFISSLPPQGGVSNHSGNEKSSELHFSDQTEWEPKSTNLETDDDQLRFPINDYKYYKEIEEFLKTGEFPPMASESYKMHLKKKSRHYLILNNELHHNPNKPKKVVMSKEDQKRLLEISHISKQKGIHLGIRKMMDKISEPYFWRGMYEDISNHVNNCPKCRDDVDVAQKLEKEKENLLVPDLDKSEDCENLKVHSTMQTSSNVWKNVEIQVHGPFKQTLQKNELVITITDPETCFVHAAAIPSNECSTKLTDFIIKTFYTFGFPNGYLISDKKLFDTVATDFNSRLKYSPWKTKLIWKENTDCSWVGQLVELLIRRKSDRWDTEMDKFMFQFRAGSIRDAFFTPTDSAPFYSMFQRSPYVGDKENFCRKIIKKKKAPIQCQECDDIFTSKILFRQHCKRHRLEESKKEKSNVILEKDSLPFDVVEENVAWAVGELKNYLSETKETRRKRGKYQRYSVEIQEHMICYALKNGAVKAALYFSQLMGTNVSDSTIRNLIKSSKNFQPRMKEEIARYALLHGVERASEHFTKLLKKDVSVKLVKRFKAIYGSRLKKKDAGHNTNKTSYSRNVNSLTEEEKEEIGRYVCRYSVDDTVNYFSEKLGIFLSEDHIHDFHNAYLSKRAINECNSEDTTTSEIKPESELLKEESLCPQEQVAFSTSNFLTENFHSYCASQPSNNQQESTHQVPEETEVKFTIKDPTSPLEASSKNPLISNNINEEIKNVNYSLGCNSDIWKQKTDLDLEEEMFDDPEHLDPLSIARELNIKRRGKYISYSPEMRARIGKYAAENGSGKASKYFSTILGHEIAKSTVRGLKDKYLNKVKHCDVTSLGYSQRGRPLRLGKYDEMVQECLKEMVRSGEKLTAFLVITTAKKIISKLEPELLKENGGKMDLNITWAKSFLKRIYVRNNT